MRLIPYVLYLFLIAFYRTILADWFSIGLAEIYLAALLVMLVALSKDSYTALWFGLAAGVVFDAPEPSYLGVHMIMFAVIGAGTAVMKERFNLDSMKSRILLLVAGMFVYSVPRVLIYSHFGPAEIFSFLLRGALPSIIYSAFIGWIFFVVQSGRISYQKLKSLF